MNTISKLAFGVLAVAFAPYAVAGDECCEKAKAANGWCAGCKHGYVNAVELKSQKLYDALKSQPAPTDMKCEGCSRALASDGVCEQCKVAFARRMMYRSMVAYNLNRGEHINPADLKCPNAMKLAENHGWCPGCKAGYVGCEKYTDKAAYEAAAKSREILLASAKAADKCEGCAVAMVTDGTCDACKVSFKDGKPAKN